MSTIASPRPHVVATPLAKRDPRGRKLKYQTKEDLEGPIEDERKKVEALEDTEKVLRESLRATMKMMSQSKRRLNYLQHYHEISQMRQDVYHKISARKSATSSENSSNADADVVAPMDV